jgi:hypothetical protein
VTRCSDCGEEHDLVDPAFPRPDVIVALAPDERRARATESDDLCRVAGADGEPARCFVRGVLPVSVRDTDDDVWWGLWVEVAPDAFERISARWCDPAQGDEPPIAATLANRVPGYDDTIGVPVVLQMVDADNRPSLIVSDDATHPFAVECRTGVTSHRAAAWLDAMM